jgi:hypothetical protein
MEMAIKGGGGGGVGIAGKEGKEGKEGNQGKRKIDGFGKSPDVKGKKIDGKGRDRGNSL